jgi:hypothetical protein
MMRYEGLLTGDQHCAGYFTTMDEDFIFLWHRRDGNPDCIRIFLLDDAKIKEIRRAVDAQQEQESDKGPHAG